jgi:hypothetical protein
MHLVTGLAASHQHSGDARVLQCFSDLPDEGRGPSVTAALCNNEIIMTYA